MKTFDQADLGLPDGSRWSTYLPPGARGVILLDAEGDFVELDQDNNVVSSDDDAAMKQYLDGDLRARVRLRCDLCSKIAGGREPVLNATYKWERLEPILDQMASHGVSRLDLTNLVTIMGRTR